MSLNLYRGFYHQPCYGRPALIAGSVVIQAINNGEVQAGDFARAAGSVALKPEGRKRFITAFERRLSQEAAHPISECRTSYQRILELQAWLLGRHLLGEIPEYPQFLTR